MSDLDTDPKEVMSYVRDRMRGNLPPDFVGGVMSQVSQTPQRRRGWTAWQLAAGLTAAAAAVAVVVIGLSLLNGRNVGNEPTPTPTASQSPSASESPTGSPLGVALPSLSPAIGCLTAPPDVELLAHLTDPAACVGDASLTFDARLVPAIADCPIVVEPTWLACPQALLTQVDETRKVDVPFEWSVAVDPPSAVNLADLAGQNVRLTGHFDDPAAQTCHETERAPQLGGTPEPVADTIARCQRTFVVTQMVALAPTSTPAPGGLALDGWARVVVRDGLNLRNRAGTGAASLGLLAEGGIGRIYAGPVQADGYTWFALAAASLPYPSGCETELQPNPTKLTCPVWFGWVAAGDASGNPWLEPVEQPCPPVPTTATGLVSIQPGIRAYCFAGRTLTINAYLWRDPQTSDCRVSYVVTPEWLYTCKQTYLSDTTEGGEALQVAIDPSLGRCGPTSPFPPGCPLTPYLGHWIAIEGHYDDAAAASCAGRESPFPFDPAHVVYECRNAFVVTAVRASSGP